MAADQKLESIVQRMIDAGESEDNIATVIQSFKAPVDDTPTGEALQMAAAGQAVPIAANLAARVATSPTLLKTATMIGRMVGGAAPVVAGMASGNPIAAATGVMASGRGAAAGGKAAGLTGRLIQSAAPPVARALDAARPYAQTLGTLSGAQGVNEIAQMMEPNRRDIGVLGVGPSANVPGAHPPVLNALLARLRKAFN